MTASPPLIKIGLMKRPTFQDVAREAQVGTATVERVLNGRGGVKPELAARVLRAVKHLRYGIRQGLSHGVVRIELLVGQRHADFHFELNRCFQQVAASLESSITLHRTFVRSGDIEDLAAYISKPTFRRAGLILNAPRHPAIAESVRRIRQQGVEVVQLLSKSVEQDVPVIAIDNYAAGRTAAYFASRMLAGQSGNFIALCHSNAFWDHVERARGFSEYLSEGTNRNHAFSRVISCEDDSFLTAQRLQHALDEDDRIIGIYSIAPTRPIASILQRQRRKIFWVGHSLNEHTASCVKSGLMDMVIDQLPELQAQRAIQTVLFRLGLMDVEVSTDPVQFVTVTAQNLPPRFLRSRVAD